VLIMASIRCKVLKGAVDGVAKDGEVVVADNNANRALINAGVLEPLHPIPAAPPPKPFKAAPKGDLAAAEDMRRRFDLAYGEALERIRALEAENADLRAQLDDIREAAALPEGEAKAPAPDAPPEGEAKAKAKAKPQSPTTKAEG